MREHVKVRKLNYIVIILIEYVRIQGKKVRIG